MYQKPSYTLTLKAADYLAKIIEATAYIELGTDFLRNIRLHRENRLRTIHSSLAIEGNTLTLNEVAAVIEGKIVAGKQTEIKEVKNAYEAYDKTMTFNPCSVKDFSQAHNLMTQGLAAEAGKFRSRDVGVFDGEVAIHIGARPQFVPQLIANLFRWAKETEMHPCLKSAVLHYEIETIHPFADGNGRMGRLWQTLVLAKWKPIFAWIPMETVIHQNRPDYYNTLHYGQQTGDSSTFVEFTLKTLLSSLRKIRKERAAQKQKKHQDKHKVKHQVELTETQIIVLKVLENKSLSRKEIFAALGMNADTRAFRRHIEPLLKAGLIKMTIPDKPNSRNQKYVRT